MWQHPPVTDSPRKLLIVEDDPGIQSQLRWCFEDYEVIAATDRATAINELRRHEPPVVLQDLGLPPDDSGVTEGLCYVFVPHTTAGVTINENADPSVKADILMVLNKVISDREPYRHLEGNSPAHVKASLIGPQLTLLVSGGRLLLGTWQGVYFCEFDGPRSRRLHLKVVPD